MQWGRRSEQEEAHSRRFKEEMSEEGVSFGKSSTRRKRKSPSQLKSDSPDCFNLLEVLSRAGGGRLCS